MIVRQRMQNFPDGGGAIGPAEPGAATTMYGPAGGTVGANRGSPVPAGAEAAATGGGAGGVAVVSTCGSV